MDFKKVTWNSFSGKREFSVYEEVANDVIIVKVALSGLIY